MKYVLIFVIIFLVAWRWRSSRESSQSDARQKKAEKTNLPLDIVECAQCGVHVPQAEAVLGQKGIYCSSKHKSLAET